MKHQLFYLFIYVVITGCSGNKSKKQLSITDSSLINLSHLDHLYTPVTFTDSVETAGIYIYAEAPDYHLVDDSDEGFTCVDDVSRAILVYIRDKNFKTDKGMQSKAVALLHFVLKMQSANGYFYNFLFTDNTINKTGKTSINESNWWSWRALQTLSEAAPVIKNIHPELEVKINKAIKLLVLSIKKDVRPPLVSKDVKGVSVPQWLPSGSASDQAAILILGLIPYCEINDDTLLKNYIKNLADGMVMMQKGDSANFPYSCFLSWENIWHAYGNDQAYALFKAAAFFDNYMYAEKALDEVSNFYPWLLKNGNRSSFYINRRDNKFFPENEKQYEQIAYGIRPMVFAAAEAYMVTGKQKYADIAGQMASWLTGNNVARIGMYDKGSGRCYDGIIAKDRVNYNSGAESTIEALLTLQKVEEHPAIKEAFNKYKKQDTIPGSH